MVCGVGVGVRVEVWDKGAGAQILRPSCPWNGPEHFLLLPAYLPAHVLMLCASQPKYSSMPPHPTPSLLPLFLDMVPQAGAVGAKFGHCARARGAGTGSQREGFHGPLNLNTVHRSPRVAATGLYRSPCMLCTAPKTSSCAAAQYVTLQASMQPSIRRMMLGTRKRATAPCTILFQSWRATLEGAPTCVCVTSSLLKIKEAAVDGTQWLGHNSAELSE
jgi:hypothetical protein